MPIIVPDNFRLPDGSALDAATREAYRQRHAARRQALIERTRQPDSTGSLDTSTETTINVVPIALGVVGVGALIYFATRE